MKKIFSLFLALALIVSMSTRLATTPAHAASIDADGASSYSYRMDMTVTAKSIPITIEGVAMAGPYGADKEYSCYISMITIGGQPCDYTVQSVSKSGGQSVVKIRINSIAYSYAYDAPSHEIQGTFSPIITLRFYGNTFSGTTFYANFKWHATSEVTQSVRKEWGLTNPVIYPLCKVVTTMSGSQNFGFGTVSISNNSVSRYRQVPRGSRIYGRLAYSDVFAPKSSLTFDMEGGHINIGYRYYQYWVKDVLIPA